MNIGVSISLVILPLLHRYSFGFYQILFIGFVLYLPTIIQIKFQWKPFKIFSRTCLGLGSGVFLLEALIFAPMTIFGILVRVLSFGTFYAIAIITLDLRMKNINSPCIGCKEGSFPYCSFKIIEMEEILTGSDLEPEPREFLTSVVNQINGNDDKKVNFESF